LFSTATVTRTPVSSIPILERGEFKKLESKKLGGGGQGDVYQDEWLGEIVAVKYFSVPIADVQQQVKHLEEAKTNQSNYLMQIKAICLAPPCAVLEYVPGRNLTDFLKVYSSMNWLRRYRLAHDIIQGLAYLHEHGLLYRDLKSANVIVVEKPRLHTKLCDFDSLKKTQAAETGSTCDKTTIGYLDPVFLQAMMSGPRISYAQHHDMYSLGWILWELATGNSPPLFPMPIQDEVVYTLKKDEKLIDTIPQGCPPDFAQCIRDCWSYPSASRPQAAELAQRMTALLRVEQQRWANKPNEKGHPPLMQAICHGKIGKVATLIDCKAEVNHVDSSGWTPLFWAEHCGKKQANRMTQLLLEAKADPTVRSPKLMSLQNELITACENGSLTKVKEAIDKGALVNLPNGQDKNPLYCAVYGMNPEAVNYLIAQHGKNAPASSWQGCEEHNKKHYGQTFLIMKFAPVYYKDWYDLLLQIEPNEFLAGYHLGLVQKVYGKEVVGVDFRDLRSYVSWMTWRGNLLTVAGCSAIFVAAWMAPPLVKAESIVGAMVSVTVAARAISEEVSTRLRGRRSGTEIGFDDYRNQIKRAIEALSPTPPLQMRNGLSSN
jgi:serine/threonine protein kinase